MRPLSDHCHTCCYVPCLAFYVSCINGTLSPLSPRSGFGHSGSDSLHGDHTFGHGGRDSDGGGSGLQQCTHWKQENHIVGCVATHIPWVIDSGASSHMIDIVSVLYDVSTSRCLPLVTFADDSTSQIDGLSTANLSSSISLPFCVFSS